MHIFDHNYHKQLGIIKLFFAKLKTRIRNDAAHDTRMLKIKCSDKKRTIVTTMYKNIKE